MNKYMKQTANRVVEELDFIGSNYEVHVKDGLVLINVFESGYTLQCKITSDSTRFTYSYNSGEVCVIPEDKFYSISNIAQTL